MPLKQAWECGTVWTPFTRIWPTFSVNHEMTHEWIKENERSTALAELLLIRSKGREDIPGAEVITRPGFIVSTKFTVTVPDKKCDSVILDKGSIIYYVLQPYF